MQENCHPGMVWKDTIVSERIELCSTDQVTPQSQATVTDITNNVMCMSLVKEDCCDGVVDTGPSQWGPIQVQSMLCMKWSSITFAARRTHVARGGVKGRAISPGF